MKSINRAMLMGHLATDPESRQTKTGKLVVSFVLATNRSWIAQDGEVKEKPAFHKIIVWEKLGEICSRHLIKGSGVMVEGRIEPREYEDKDGKKQKITEIVAEDVNILTWLKQKDQQEKKEKEQKELVAA